MREFKYDMKIPMNDLSRGIAKSEVAQDAIVRVLQGGHWVHGPEHRDFEIELAEFLNANHVFGVASGTDAIEIALRAIGCTRGSKIISVANAGGYTPIAAAAIGCEVIYCDIDPNNLLMNPESLAPLLSEGIAVVVVTHLYGNVAPVGAIRRMCEPFGIKIVEDCAQAIGATEDGKRVGTIGHVGTFSFYPTKNLGAIGDGGALATNDPEIAQRILELRQYGWTSKYKIDISGGMNSRLDEIQAAVLRIGLLKLDSMNLKRRQIIGQYSEALKNSELKLVTSFDINNAAHLAVVIVPESYNRDIFRMHMKEFGIQTDIHYPILDCEQLGLHQSAVKAKLDQSRKYSNLIVSIPLFPELIDSEVNQITAALSHFH
jgi:dTDP-3-amino-2,3,6-trideoxy-4-keto-D-glucose/dTDP-3-amino-3,4,6-trideoxy-alpha-D-glucose/dTDP-2,6-dideoxy-D-kanosamine transaminase